MENNFSRLVGERLLTISEIHVATGISRNQLTALYYRRTKGIQFETVKKLCDFLEIPMSELIEYQPEIKGGEK
ncbi:hypothetical protein CAR_c08870 [Carnobacterium sp. 17-4]|uniref:helix-turn-helix domain-containing protein n=1 Tax=Carnobacterium sp. (strain 17-4) TaxID=208596 RepID=UPI0002058CDA|nr:helix-turn-helix transcriptional regulator [Carnobacterium sp. 17-4]AEB29580.1 hypothetical protein CAR_c08870 [Carnobacterium sp. 17-4]